MRYCRGHPWVTQAATGGHYSLGIYQAENTCEPTEFPPHSGELPLLGPILQMEKLRQGKWRKQLAQTYGDGAGSAGTPPPVTNLGG